MGFFDRMSNLGKGVGKVWAKNAREALDKIGKGDWGDDNWGDGEPQDALDRRLKMLDKLRSEGLLSNDEYQAKRAEVVASAPRIEEPEMLKQRGAAGKPAQTDGPEGGDEPRDVTKNPMKRSL